MNGIAGRLRLPPEPSSVAIARRHVAEAVGSAGTLAELAILLASELASNAVLHAHTAFELAVIIERDLVRVEVYDSSPVMPSLKSYVAESVDGRGLHMIAASADR